MDISDLVGNLLVWGFPHKKATKELIDHFKETRAGGVILYRPNYDRSPHDVLTLLKNLQEGIGKRLLHVIDHEGGRVIMFPRGLTVFPDNQCVGKTGDVELARRQGAIEAKELRRYGVDVNFAPSVDVLTEAYSPNIGIRSYSLEPDVVAEMAAARIKATQDHGVSSTAKHFPGKGHSPLDAHLALPVIPSTWEDMEKIHVKPFRRAIEIGVDVIMSSHPLYPNLDSNYRTPATFSRKIIHDYLRIHLGFEGVICSDDLEMGAIRELCPIGEAAVRTLEAGHDLILSCHDLNAERQVQRAVVDAVKSGRLKLKDLEASYERVEALKKKRPIQFEGGEPKIEPEGPPLAEEMCLRGVTILRDNQRKLPINLQNKSVSVVFPKISAISMRMMVEPDIQDETQFLVRRLSNFGVKPKSVHIVPIDAEDGEIQRVVKEAAQADLTLMFPFDAHLYPSNKKLLEAVLKESKETVVGLLRDPYDEELVNLFKPDTAVVTAYGFRICQVDAVLRKIFEG